jgi:putative sugar O-methyltransferase
MKNIINKNLLFNNIIDKIIIAIKEKRFFKSFRKKIYPYLKGLTLSFSIRKFEDEIILVTPKSNIVDVEGDLELGKNLFKFYKKMKNDQLNINQIFKPSLLWNNHIKRDFSLLNKSLKKNDLNEFLFFLQNFGNQKYDLGIFDHFSKSYSKNFFLKKFLRDELYRGQINLWKHFNNKKKFKDLDLPKFGNLHGAIIENNFINFGAPVNQIYAKIIKNYLESKKKNTIAELGAGYGRLPYYYLKNEDNCCFIDFDLPEVLVLAAYYLIKSFPKKKYFLYGDESFSKDLVSNYDLIFLPNWEIEKIQDNSIDMFINKNSLGEIDPDSAKNYISNIHRTSKYFFSINHEFMRNEFENDKYSLVNEEFNIDKKFKILIRYPDLAHLIYESNKIDFDQDIYFYIYKKN